MTGSENDLEITTIGGGCFWCTEAVFQRIEGVKKVVSGYTGGNIKDPTYREICSGLTGHAEVIQIRYDPQVVSLDRLFAVFFATHDPTTLNRQGNDKGTQYRSVIYYATPEQETIAHAAIKKAQEAYSEPIVTEVSPLGKFYRAEDYHQNYYVNNKSQPYCQFVIAPKLKYID
jgi:methionine-S-sulfoxide reductase